MRKVLVAGALLGWAMSSGCAGSEVPTNSGGPPASVGAPVGAGGSTSGPSTAPTAGGTSTGTPPLQNPPTTPNNNPPGGSTAVDPPPVAPQGPGMKPEMPIAGSNMGSAGAAGSMEPMAGGMAPMPGALEPTVPMLTAQCPAFRDSNITFMSLSGIAMAAGPKASAEKSAPMVFYWHGTGSTSGEYALMATGVHQGVVSEGGVLISFATTTGGDVTSGTLIFGRGDWNLADQLLACAVQNHNVDPRRVYATGCSAGGLFSTAMAAGRSSYIAAAAPNSGGWSFPTPFQNENVPALMTVHGAPGVDWVGIDFSVSSKTADDAFKAAGGFVINCNHGGGHCGGGSLSGDIWKFFKAHPYGTQPSPWKGALPAGFSPRCKLF